MTPKKAKGKKKATKKKGKKR